jgi:tight adherence protein B
MRAGHSVASGINAMAKSASEPSRAEWSRVVADEQLGVPLDAAMRPLGERMDCQDIEQVALVADLQHRSGGNMADVIDRVAEGVRDRADLRRELDALTAQARLSRWVVTALPAVVLGALALIRPHYVAPLFDSSGGQIMLGVAIVLIIIGSLVMRAITEIKA